MFAAAGQFVKSDQVEHRAEFAEAYDAATKVRGVAWNLSAGLYWAHPWDFLPLDKPSRQYMTEHLDLRIPTSGGKGPCDAKSYLKLLDDLKGSIRGGELSSSQLSRVIAGSLVPEASREPADTERRCRAEC